MLIHACVFVLTVSAFCLDGLAQVDTPAFETEVKSAFVWGEDKVNGANSSSVADPRTGQRIHKLEYGGIEVSSRIGFERIARGEVGEFIEYTAAVVNSTGRVALLRVGGVSVDEGTARQVHISQEHRHRREKDYDTDVAELSKLYCLTSGFLSTDNLVSADPQGGVLVIEPSAALTVTVVARDPSHYSIRCSSEGCHPVGALRYFVTVNGRDYVFLWPGRSVPYCGD